MWPLKQWDDHYVQEEQVRKPPIGFWMEGKTLVKLGTGRKLLTPHLPSCLLGPIAGEKRW